MASSTVVSSGFTTTGSTESNIASSGSFTTLAAGSIESFTIEGQGLDGRSYRAEVNEDGGANVVTSDGRFFIMKGGDRSDVGWDPIWPREARITVQNEDLQKIFEQSTGDIPVEIFNTDGSDRLAFRGYLNANFSGDQPQAAINVIDLGALDGIGLLEGATLDQTAVDVTKEEVRLSTGIPKILGYLYGMDVEFGVNYYPKGGGLTASDCPLEHVTFFPDNYRDPRGDDGDWMTALDVLRDLLKNQQMVLKQVERSGGAKWLCVQRDAYQSDGTLRTWTYDNTGTQLSGPTDRDRSTTLNLDGTQVAAHPNRNFEDQRRLVQVTHDHAPIDELVGEPGFEDDGAAWTLNTFPSGSIFVQVGSHDSFNLTPDATQQNEKVLQMAADDAQDRLYATQNLERLNQVPPLTYGRLSFKSVLRTQSDTLFFRYSVDGNYLTTFARSINDDFLSGKGEIILSSGLNRAIPEGARLPIAKSGTFGLAQTDITLTQRAQRGDTILRGEISDNVNEGWVVRYAGFVGSQDRIYARSWRQVIEQWGDTEIFVDWVDANGNRLEGPSTMRIGGNFAGAQQQPTEGWVDDINLSLEVQGQPLTKTITQATVPRLGDTEDKMTVRTLSGPSNKNIGRLGGIDTGGASFFPTEWGLGADDSQWSNRQNSLAELITRQRLRFWMNHNRRFQTVALNIEDLNQHFTGDELVTYQGREYTIHWLRYVPQEAELRMRLIQHTDWDPNVDNIVIATVTEAAEGVTTGGTAGGGTATGGSGKTNTEISSFRPGILPLDAFVLSHLASHKWQINTVRFKLGVASVIDFKFDIDILDPDDTIIQGTTVTIPGGQRNYQADINLTIEADQEVRVTGRTSDSDIADVRTALDVS